MRKRSAEELVSDVRFRTGLEDSEFCTDAEILEYLNQERAELDQRMRRNEGHVHRVFARDIAVVADTVSYDLPQDFSELLGLTASIEGMNQPLEPFMENERADLLNANTTYPYAGFPKYRIMGEAIEFLPSTLSFTATMRYAPGSARLRLGKTPPDFVSYPNGQEVAMIYGACATVLQKEDKDPSFYLTQKERVMLLIDAAAAQRDASHPERVTDVTGGISWPDPWGN